MLVGSLAGVASSMTVIVEKIALLKDPGGAAFCDINAALGCTPALLAPESSVLGPPNAAIGLALFAFFAATALAGLLGTAFPKSYMRISTGLALFFLGFLTWYMSQVAFVIGSLCLLCLVCTVAVLTITAAVVRVSHRAGVLGSPGGAVDIAVRSGADVILVVGWGLVIAAMLYVGIWL